MDIGDISCGFEVVNDDDEKKFTGVTSSLRTPDGSEQCNLISTNTSTEKHSEDLSLDLHTSSDLIRTSSEVLCDSGASMTTSLECFNNSASPPTAPSAQSLSPVSPFTIDLQAPSDGPPMSTTSSSLPPTLICSADTLVVGNLRWRTSLAEIIVHTTVGHQVHMCIHSNAYEKCNRQTYSLIWLLINPPINQELLRLTTSIKHFSKYNKKTAIIWVSQLQINVDLLPHGIDELIVQPVTKNIVQNIYTRLTTVQLNQAKQVTEDTCSNGNISGAVSSTNNLVGVDDIEVIKPQFPELEQSAAIEGQPCTTKFSSQLKPSNISNLSNHSAKEKLRRERIKESCCQLRVLLPYVRGRKTDMASILEFVVNYLKIVNDIIPNDLQSQIKDILSKEYELKEQAMKYHHSKIIPIIEAPIPVSNNRNTNREEGQDCSSDKQTLVSEICQKGPVQHLLSSVCNVQNSSANVVTTTQTKRPSHKMDVNESTGSLESNDSQQLLQYTTNKELRLEMTRPTTDDEITLIENRNNFKEYSTPSRMTTTVSTDSRPLQSNVFHPEFKRIFRSRNNRREERTATPKNKQRLPGLFPVVNDNFSKKNEVNQGLQMQMHPYTIPIHQMKEFSVHRHIAQVRPQTQLFCQPRQYINIPNPIVYPAGYFNNSLVRQTEVGRFNFKNNEYSHSTIPMYCLNNQIPKPNSIKVAHMSNISQPSYHSPMIGEPLVLADLPLNSHIDTLPNDETNELFYDFGNLQNTPNRTSNVSFLEPTHNNSDCGNNTDGTNSNTNSCTTNKNETFNNFGFSKNARI